MEVSNLHVSQVRAFNRFYTARIGILREGVHDSPFSLTEVRVLLEICYQGGLTASAIAKELDLDTGYLSRILRRFGDQGFIVKTPSKKDARQHELKLTAKGREVFGKLDEQSNEQVRKMLEELPPEDVKRLMSAIHSIQRVLGSKSDAYTLRPHQPGDMGWVVYRHGHLYAEQGYDERFEAIVAEIVAKFLREFDPEKERCWIAERDGEIVGSVFLVKGDKGDEAKLRLLLVEPSARGLGIGRRLVDECVNFAGLAGYCKITLWTQSDLHTARRIYAAGFRMTEEKPHTLFGPEHVAETWEREL